jgi:hypothetical protein
MSDTIQTLSLGGQERTLEFGTMGFLKHLGRIIKSDPLDLFSEGYSTDPEKSYKACFAFVYAGLLADCDMKGTEPDFDSAQVDKWVSCLKASSLGEIVLTGYAALTGNTVDDIKKKAETKEVVLP